MLFKDSFRFILIQVCKISKNYKDFIRLLGFHWNMLNYIDFIGLHNITKEFIR